MLQTLSLEHALHVTAHSLESTVMDAKVQYVVFVFNLVNGISYIKSTSRFLLHAISQAWNQLFSVYPNINWLGVEYHFSYSCNTHVQPSVPFSKLFTGSV